MKIALFEPFYASSHKQWADGLIENSSHDIDLFSLPGRHWKWRMHGSAVSLVKQFMNKQKAYDLVLATDMIDLSTFVSLGREKLEGTKIALYFHENQLTYPWSKTDPDVTLQRDNHYAFINYISALVADHVFFNSEYHRASFISALPGFLKSFPDHNEVETVQEIEQRSSVLHLGLDLAKFDRYRHKEKYDVPLILWNHRWEYDKNPSGFFNALENLKKEGFDFKLAVLGEKYRNQPACFNEAKEKFSKELVHFGFVDEFAEYAYWLWKADILPVTSYQDFFGMSVVEAIYCNTVPIVPDRLAYDTYTNSSHTYKNGREMVDLINSWQQISIPDVSHFDWQRMILEYDSVFNQI